ncbi:DUF2177 family protein [Phenylobacterium sp. J367]|uniref:DUF2177 family protein n=1 Tax=Phenylobacterium sp. J367 TaxID=2898435 RepID=UPI0021514C7B|nr:DUF2177 family protein [Phenylobacterium sp. J367]MCR5878904.1 DUF2177 family protein [Phenylobacterium sp. J367]
MWNYALSFLIFAVVFGIMDFLWLSNAFRAIYQPAIGSLLADKVRIAPAALFYLVYVAGVTFFVVAPAMGAGDWRQAMLRGAALGLVAYATYDLTNQATLKTWPTSVTLIDLGWESSRPRSRPD